MSKDCIFVQARKKPDEKRLLLLPLAQKKQTSGFQRKKIGFYRITSVTLMQSADLLPIAVF